LACYVNIGKLKTNARVVRAERLRRSGGVANSGVTQSLRRKPTRHGIHTYLPKSDRTQNLQQLVFKPTPPPPIKLCSSRRCTRPLARSRTKIGHEKAALRPTAVSRFDGGGGPSRPKILPGWLVTFRELSIVALTIQRFFSTAQQWRQQLFQECHRLPHISKMKEIPLTECQNNSCKYGSQTRGIPPW
jgi:hypothetical protein